MKTTTIPLKIYDLNPFAVIREWLDIAKQNEGIGYNAMSLATADENGLPDLRMVLLKGFDERGFVFYTNMTSAKGAQIKKNPQAAINFHWKTLSRCLRARGRLEKVSQAESNAYFQSRPRRSRLASMASDQSSPLSSREDLLEQILELEKKFGANDEDGEVLICPEHWYGHRLIPTYIEFWQDGEFRIHDRYAYRRETIDSPWNMERLSP